MSVTASKLISAAGGSVVGRIRLQKIVYLLQEAGLGKNYKFKYYHYGPYSEQLSNEVELDVALFGSIVEDEATGASGYKYSIYRSQDPTGEHLGGLPTSVVLEICSSIKARTSVVAELAATIHWLKNYEAASDVKSELNRRKPQKFTEERFLQACSLLDEIGLGSST